MMVGPFHARRCPFAGIVSLCFFVGLFVGCGPKSKVAHVNGTVLLDDKPIAAGAVVTMPASGRGAKGRIENGKFELGTFGSNDGALLGIHKVAVIANAPPKGAGPEAAPGKLLVPERYTNPETSGLTIEVKPGDNSPVLKLTSP